MTGATNLTVRTGGSMTVGEQNYIIATNTASVTMPTGQNRNIGRTVIVKRATSNPVSVSSSSNFYHNGVEGTSMNINTVGQAYQCVWDGSYWQVFIMG